MKKVFLMGRSEAGKTSLTQALKGEELHYHKTQYTNSMKIRSIHRENTQNPSISASDWRVFLLRQMLLQSCRRQMNHSTYSVMAADVSF